MNKFLSIALVSVFALGSAVFTSCSKEDPQEYTVTLTDDGNGTAVADKAKAEAGMTVTLTATPDEGYVFGKWAVQSGGATLSPSVTTNPATFTMPENNVSIKAEFIEAETEEQITLPDQSDKNQTAFADEETTKGFTLIAKSAWTATIEETVTKATRASNVSWLRLTVNGAETYSGAAGTFTIVINIDPNTTGKDRTATITIDCGGEQVKITVMQKGVKEDNTPLTNKDLLVAHPWKHVISVTQYPKSWDNPETTDVDESVREDKSVFTITIKADGTVTVTSTQGGESIPYTLSGNTFTLHNTAEDGTPFDMKYAITKLTANEFESVGTFQGTENNMNPDGTEGPITTFTYTQTMKFVKP